MVVWHRAMCPYSDRQRIDICCFRHRVYR